MITPQVLDEMLTVLRKHNVMSANLECGGDRIAVTLGPDFPEMADTQIGNSDTQNGSVVASGPGGWKAEPSDPQDPDPLGLGTLDMAPADEAFDVQETEL
jgi:hypothetical protein